MVTDFAKLWGQTFSSVVFSVILERIAAEHNNPFDGLFRGTFVSNTGKKLEGSHAGVPLTLGTGGEPVVAIAKSSFVTRLTCVVESDSVHDQVDQVDDEIFVIKVCMCRDESSQFRRSELLGFDYRLNEIDFGFKFGVGANDFAAMQFVLDRH